MKKTCELEKWQKVGLIAILSISTLILVGCGSGIEAKSEATPTPTSSESIPVLVEAGESLWSISQMCHASFPKVQELNGKDTKLFAGGTALIPSGAELKGCVSREETIARIKERCKVSPATLSSSIAGYGWTSERIAKEFKVSLGVLTALNGWEPGKGLPFDKITQVSDGKSQIVVQSADCTNFRGLIEPATSRLASSPKDRP